MGANMRATGGTTWPTEEVDLFIQMAMYMKENGLTIKLMEEVPMFTWTVPNILANGEKTSNMDSVLRHGLTVPNTRAITSMERSMVQALLSGLTAPCTSENSTTTTFMVREFTPGPMVASTKANGAIIKCTGKEPFHGQTEESMLVSMWTIRSRVTESSCGPMVAVTRVTGKEVNSMARVCTSLAKAPKNMENGKMAKGSVGSVKILVPLTNEDPFLYIVFSHKYNTQRSYYPSIL
jgi:hypothetical protein